MKKITKFRRSAKAVSPVIAVLLMIVIAVASALFAYSWVMGYLDFLTIKTDQGVQIQAIALVNGTAPDTKDLIAYAQNVGQSEVTLANVYVNDVLYPANFDPSPTLGTSGPTQTTKITVENYVGPSQVTLKVVTDDGNIFQLKKTVTTSTVEDLTPTTPPTVTEVQSHTTGFVSPTAGNMLVVIAGHRTGDPVDHHAPTISGGWTLQQVAWYDSVSGDNDRRIVAVFTKPASGTEGTVTINWNDNENPTTTFVIYKEFNATSFSKVGFGVNSEGSNPTPTTTWATSPMEISATYSGSATNILSIGAAVWRDGNSDITAASFTGISFGNQGAFGSSCPGVAAYNYGSAVTQTSLSWNGANTDDMVSGLIVLFECS